MVQLNNLSVLNYVNNFTMWHYQAQERFDYSHDDWHVNYFNKASTLLRAGDIIYVIFTDTYNSVRQTARVEQYFVSTVEGGEISLTRLT